MLVKEIEIKVEKKNIKNIHLYVKPPHGEVLVTCPANCSDERIELFVRSKIGWIKKRREEFNNQIRQTTREYVSGESVFLLGRQYYLKVKDASQKYCIAIDGEYIDYEVRKGATIEQKSACFTEWYREIFRKELGRLIPKWEKITGLKCNSYKIVNMKSKWGSCISQKREIILNLKLVKRDVMCIEYVILHEMMHFLEHKHNKNFIALLEKYMPNWEIVKDQLNTDLLEHFDE